jgi:hypothetical protein
MQIQKMGRWQGATFKEYIGEELANYSEGMSMAMKTKFNLMNIAGNEFRNIIDTVLTMDCNTEFSWLPQRKQGPSQIVFGPQWFSDSGGIVK